MLSREHKMIENKEKDETNRARSPLHQIVPCFSCIPHFPPIFPHYSSIFIVNVIIFHMLSHFNRHSYQNSVYEYVFCMYAWMLIWHLHEYCLVPISVFNIKKKEKRKTTRKGKKNIELAPSPRRPAQLNTTAINIAYFVILDKWPLLILLYENNRKRHFQLHNEIDFRCCGVPYTITLAMIE